MKVNLSIGGILVIEEVYVDRYGYVLIKIVICVCICIWNSLFNNIRCGDGQ